MKEPTIERVIYWCLYFKTMREYARKVQEEWLKEWYGMPDAQPKGIIDLKNFRP